MVRNSLLITTNIDPPLPKPEEKFEAEEKKQNELIRRWKVHVYQIEIVNLTNKTMDPFIQFIIGGDYYVSNNTLALLK